MGQEKIPFSEGTDCGLEGFTGHPPGEQHTREVSVADDAGCPESGARQGAEELQHQPLDQATVPHGGDPELQRKVRGQRLARGADPANSGLLQHHIQHQRHQMNVLVTIESEGDFTGELLIPLQLMTDGRSAAAVAGARGVARTMPTGGVQSWPADLGSASSAGPH